MKQTHVFGSPFNEQSLLTWVRGYLLEIQHSVMVEVLVMVPYCLVSYIAFASHQVGFLGQVI